MEKKRADQIIEYYTRPMYGFALNKMGNTQEAEELASRIILEVYYVLCHKDDFVDLNSYVFKIAHNVWARYIAEKTKKKCELQLDETSGTNHEEGPDKRYIDQETEGTLRREIAYLSKQQREIIVSYYYKQMKIKEIAEELGISEGTVKWNLFDAKKELKTGMKAIRTIGNLGINPIKFADMGHTGQPGEKGDTRDFFAKVITQNIAYAAYHEPRTIRELAEELGISPVFIEDEVKILEEYGFMECLPGGRYQTQMIIREPSASETEDFRELAKEYGKILYEEYYKQFLGLEDEIKDIGIYYPDEDFNCLLWTLIPFSIQFFDMPEAYKVDPDEVMIYRKDGGKYIAMAILEKSIELSCEGERYCAMVMTRDNSEENKVYGWQAGVYWSGRALEWRDNKYSDYVGMMHFVTGQLIENEVTQEIYSRLLEKEYLVRTPKGYKLNVVHIAGKEQMEKLQNLFPKPSDTLRKKLLEYDERCYKMNKVGHPAHMHKTLRYLAQGRMQHLWPYVFEEMLNQGVLKKPTESQQKAIATLLYTLT